MRARMALAVSGQRCELREVVLKSKPPEMLAASPKGTVPVLVLPSGEVIDESLDIMLWALRRNDPEGWLTPQRGSLDDMQALIAENDGVFKRSLDRYKYPNRYPQEHSVDVQQFAQVHQANGAGWLAGLESRLESGGWLFGNGASLADMAILPFVRQFAHTDTAWFAAQPWPNLLAWLARWEAGALYQSVMEKYPPWQTGHAGVDFPAATTASR
ncbi:glutathione S-transferase [Polaromonas sp. P2-4]|nr:glutathione S-transferase [Polaromonas sp. P2-4]